MAGGSADPVSGRLIAGRYRLGAELGRGGMAVVYDGLDVDLERRVAIKILRRDRARSETLELRFLREARAAAKLSSDHVAVVLDVGALDDGGEQLPCIVMERLEGCDLRQLLSERGALAPEMAIDCVMQACVALSEAHARGLIHRDLKPSNLFLARRADGSARIKVLDFGIAKALEGEGEDVGLTSVHDVLGSPRYMSPEQLRASAEVDARSDVWALGVVLYELLSDKPPFVGSSVAEVHAAVLEHVPAPLEVGSRELAAAVHRCLMKEPGMRYPSVVAMARALAPFGSAVGRAALEAIERHATALSDAGRITSPVLSGPGEVSVDSLAASAGGDTATTPLSRREEGAQTQATWDAGARVGARRARGWMLAAAAVAALAIVWGVAGRETTATRALSSGAELVAPVASLAGAAEAVVADPQEVVAEPADSAAPAVSAAPARAGPRARPAPPAPPPSSPYDERE